MAALRMQQHGRGADLGLFQHGLVFCPKEDEEDIYRTVVISNIPREVNMTDVLKPVCGGPLYSVQLLRTAHFTGSHTAIVVFLYEEDAAAFVKYASSNEVTYFNNRANVSLVRTPTYPISKNMEQQIFKKGHTRCLSVSKIPVPRLVRDVLDTLLAWNGVYGNLLEGIYEIETGTAIHIRFHSIHAAGLAFSALGEHPDYKDCDIRFVADPCARPAVVEENNAGGVEVAKMKL